jgi:hypothetical protein
MPHHEQGGASAHYFLLETQNLLLAKGTSGLSEIRLSKMSTICSVVSPDFFLVYSALFPKPFQPVSLVPSKISF